MWYPEPDFLTDEDYLSLELYETDKKRKHRLPDPLFWLFTDGDKDFVGVDQQNQVLLAGEMRDLICDKVHEFDREFVYSTLLQMGAFFYPF